MVANEYTKTSVEDKDIERAQNDYVHDTMSFLLNRVNRISLELIMSK